MAAEPLSRSKWSALYLAVHQKIHVTPHGSGIEACGPKINIDDIVHFRSEVLIPTRTLSLLRVITRYHYDELKHS